MDAIQAIVLGIVQGLTEFLPISSSAHLRIVPAFLGWDDPGAAFTAVVQLGTMAAVLLYFRRDLVTIATEWVRGLREPRQRSTEGWRLGWYLIIGTIPIGIFGLAFSNQIETGARNLTLIGIALIVAGLVLASAERVSQRDRDIHTVDVRDATIIGFAQACALIPGVSRSGSTITTGLFLGMRRETAARFSFLLSLPITGGAALKKVYDLVKDGGLATGERLPFILGIVTSGLVGYACIYFLLRYLQRNTTVIFTVYRVLLGLIILLLVAIR